MSVIVKALRNKIGASRGYGGCQECGDRWNWKKPHRLWLGGARGILPCCEECWIKMTPEEKLSHCGLLFQEWQIHEPTLDIDDLIEKAKRAIDSEISKVEVS